MPHLVVLLPGIMGSVLQHRGRDLWSLSGQAIGAFLHTLGSNVELLALGRDDLEREVLEDNIRATRLIEEIYDVPRLIKGAGYRTIQRELERVFALEAGEVANPQRHQNFFPFPYDWRRDIRVGAARLGRFIEAQLPRWRDYSGHAGARAILIAHSMGGLVARAYIELLGGHEHVECLYTLGTPHRGSPQALNALSNGLNLRAGPLELELATLSRVVRSFSSVYQLLPIYPVVEQAGGLKRVAEVSNLPHIDQESASRARAVLVGIGDAALARRRADAGAPAPTIPVVGYGQDTSQYGFFESTGAVTLSSHPLPGLAVADGDGTVPLFSAIPSEIQELQLATERFTNQHHGWLPNGTHSLGALVADLSYRLNITIAPLRGGNEEARQAIRVSVDDLHRQGDAVRITAQTFNIPRQALPLVGSVVQIDGVERRRATLQPGADGWWTDLERLPPGLYQVEVRPEVPSLEGPSSVFTTFQVVAAAPQP